MRDFNHSLPPQNVEAEEAILGGILLDPNAIGRIISLLNPDDFYIGVHKEIYRAAIELHEANKPTDLMTVTSWFQDRACLDKIGGTGKLSQLVERTVSSANIDKYAESVQEKSLRRSAISFANEIARLSGDPIEKIETTLLKSAEKLLDLSKSDNSKDSPQRVSDCVLKVYDELLLANMGEESIYPVIPSGFVELDRLMGGFHKGEVTTIAARPAMGKSAMSFNLAYRMASQGVSVCIHSCEMTRSQSIKRLLGIIGGVRGDRFFRTNALDERAMELTHQAIADLSELPIWIDEKSAPNPLEIRQDLMQAKMEANIKAAIIDYGGLLSSSNKSNYGTRALEVSAIVRELKAIAKDLDIAIVLLAQINRGVEQRQDKRPTLSDIKESGAYEEHSGILIGLYRDEYYYPGTNPNALEIIVLKSRYSATGTITLFFDAATGRIDDLKEV